MALLTRTLSAIALGAAVLLPFGAAAAEVGIFLGNQPNCQLSNDEGSKSCRKDGTISAGDIIATRKDPATLAIQWLAPGSVRLVPVSAGKYRVTVSPPPEPKGVVTLLGDMLGFTRKAGRISHNAVTRDSAAERVMLPGDNASLLPGVPVTFSWCTDGMTRLAIISEAGMKVREVAVPPGLRSLTALPEELGLVAGSTYRWEPVGAAAEGGRISLLAGEAATSVTDTLALLDGGAGSAGERGLKKAVFLQFLTDNYAGRYAFGWLQYLLVNQLSASLVGDDDLAAAARLKGESGVQVCR